MADIYTQVERLLGEDVQMTLLSEQEQRGQGDPVREVLTGRLVSLVPVPVVHAFLTHARTGSVTGASYSGGDEAQIILPPDPNDPLHPTLPWSKWVPLETIADVQAA